MSASYGQLGFEGETSANTGKPEIVINRQTLLRELAPLVAVIEKKVAIPAVGCFLLEAETERRIRLTATNMEATLAAECEAETHKKGALLLPARHFHEIVKNLPDAPIRIAGGGETGVSVTCAQARYRLFSPDPDVYPKLPEPIQPFMTLTAPVLRTMIERTGFAASAEETHYQLRSVQFSLRQGEPNADQPKLRMVGTDGRRMGLVETQTGFTVLNQPEETNFLIDRKTLGEVAKLIGDASENDEIAFGADQNFIMFQCGGRRLTARRAAGLFPNYEVVIPKNNDKTIVLALQNFSAALKRVSVVAEELTYAVVLTLTPGQMEISAKSETTGEASEIIPVDYPGPTMKVGFNVTYLLECCSRLRNERIALDLKDEISAFMLRPLQDEPYDYRYIVMPMRLTA